MPRRSAGPMPPFSARAAASPIASRDAAIRKLPASLTRLAAPGSSPYSKTPFPSASSRERTRRRAAAGPARHSHRFPPAAASGRPKTGQAT
jgi:hypothetical protein